MVPEFISFSRENKAILPNNKNFQSKRAQECRKTRRITTKSNPIQDVPEPIDVHQDESSLIKVQMMPIVERRTSWKYKDADPCFVYRRSSSSVHGTVDVDTCNCGHEEKDAEYKDYDALPYRWRLAREEC